MFKIEIDPQAKIIYLDTLKSKALKLKSGYFVDPVSKLVGHSDGSGMVNAQYYNGGNMMEVVEVCLDRETPLSHVDAVKALRESSNPSAGLKEVKDFYDEYRNMGYIFRASGRQIE